MCMAVHRWLLAVLLLACVPIATPAQDAQPKDEPQPFQEIPFWNTDRGEQVAAAVALFGELDGIRATLTRKMISESPRSIAGWPMIQETVLPLNAAFLEVIKDGRPWPDMTRRNIRDLKGPDIAVYSALLQAILRSNRATSDMFERSAVDHKNVTYSHLATQPNKYRGKIITITGKMANLRENQAPPDVRGEVPVCYSGEIIGPTKGAPPFVVLFTELPRGVQPNEQFNTKVTFQGYFIAHMLFSGGKDSGQKDVVAPYLVGRTITLNEKAPPAPAKVMDELPSNAYNIVLIAGTAVAIVLVFFMIVNIWLRRADSRTQAQLLAARNRAATFEFEPDEPPDEPQEKPQASTEVQGEPRP